MTIKVGDRIKDNDPRMGTRILTVTKVLPNGVVAEDRTFRAFPIMRRRIYTDGKPRRSGFSVIQEPRQ